MRRSAEAAVWSQLKKARQGGSPKPLELASGTTIDLDQPCIVLGGRNGAGKSRLLRRIESELGSRAVLINLHHLCEQALIIARSRDDLSEMLEEFEPVEPTDDRLDDIQRIIGREYDAVTWWALELEPSEPGVAERFRWAGDQALVPYFRLSYRGQEYETKDMGLGELSVHFLFWILEQYRESEDLVLLLDEPDAFLPPIGVEALLSRLLHLCLKRKWRLVVTTHSEELINRAVEEQAFVLLRATGDADPMAVHVIDDPTVAMALLSRPPIDHVYFCEDESACYLTQALLEATDVRQSRSASVVWGNGHGYLRALRDQLPVPPRPEIRFTLVFDGDQRGTLSDENREDQWPARFLPTDDDPDTLFRGLRAAPEQLASRLGVSLGELEVVLESLEGNDPHDWVDSLAERYGRAHVLESLAKLSVSNLADGNGAITW